jgi:hypothetical protein
VQAVCGLVTLANCLLAVVIGVRLVRLGVRSRGPEIWLGAYFLGSAFLGTILSSTVYMSWADPMLALPDGLRSTLHAADLVATSAGLLGVQVFTWRVFRPRSERARLVVLASAAIAVLALIGVGATERFHVRVVNGPCYWLGYAVREAAIVWMAAESFLYFGRLRRRLRLGLVDPLLANRFLLWGIWAATVSVMNLSDPVARVGYWWVTGTTTEWLPDVGRPMIAVTLIVTSALGAVTAATLFLTFFPTAGFRRWVTRSPSAAA